MFNFQHWFLRQPRACAGEHPPGGRRPDRARPIRTLTVLAIGSLAAVGATGGVVAGGNAGDGHVTTSFERVAPDVFSPSGQSVMQDCQTDEAKDPTGWADAMAELKIREHRSHSEVTITVRDARPNTYFTVWLRLGGMDSNGDGFGGNPVTDGQATPLSPTSDLQNLLAATGPGNGTDQVSNGFRTDSRGNAKLELSLDFPIVGGAYPFQRFPDWDPSDPRLPADEPAIYPVAIAGPQGIYTFRVVSHCTDDVGHGLQSGPRELWFDWTAPA